ncbi:hypothetical protein B0J11DRAFT_142391 [Dendryphion nanum]|uniref:Uncharacterized protein n=1 Tax=Dendryphion nanum TaxID=256645 RepID=A0A9P9D7M8_9PLEO|nr:hypothetical protein B0J11DRAFT_142391 [Dendryphion nanum]
MRRSLKPGTPIPIWLHRSHAPLLLFPSLVGFDGQFPNRSSLIAAMATLMCNRRVGTCEPVPVLTSSALRIVKGEKGLPSPPGGKNGADRRQKQRSCHAHRGRQAQPPYRRHCINRVLLSMDALRWLLRASPGHVPLAHLLLLLHLALPSVPSVIIHCFHPSTFLFIYDQKWLQLSKRCAAPAHAEHLRRRHSLIVRRRAPATATETGRWKLRFISSSRVSV